MKDLWEDEWGREREEEMMEGEERERRREMGDRHTL